MAQNTTVSIAEGDWGQLTNADVTSITFQNLTPGQKLYVKGTTDGTEPTTLDGALVYGPFQGEANSLLSDLFPGVSAARVWAYNDAEGTGNIDVMVSHA